VAVEASGDILVANEGVTGGTQLLRITPSTGDRVVLSANGTGSGPTLTGASVGRQNGVIYLMDQAGTIMSVDPVAENYALLLRPALTQLPGGGSGGGPDECSYRKGVSEPDGAARG
jgi:hypothetical protein